MAASEADHELQGFPAHTLRPTSLGTALPFKLVTECLHALDADFPHWSVPMRLATLRAICLCSKSWSALGRCFLYSQVGVSLQPIVVHAPRTPRSLRLLATLLARRSLASLIVNLTLRIEGARAVDLLAVTSLFDDLSGLSYLEVSFGDHEVRHLSSKLGLLQHANRLMLQGPVTPSLARALFSLERIDKLRIRGPFPDEVCLKPAFTLRQLILERETSLKSFHVLTSYAMFRLQHLALTASDSQEPPSLSWFLCLRTLIILQPYRGSKHAQRSRKVDSDKLAAFVAAVLGSARRLPLLDVIAFRNPDQLGNANWPDMRRSSAQIFGVLPYSLGYLSLSTAATSLDLRHVDDLLIDKATRTPALARISMDKTAKALVPRPDDEYERRAAAKGVEIVWTSNAALSAA
ncbi:hypothetical protein C6P46_002417 [Rhodotorula mucilaginosa]|jgi:hypothetical protein|uniref:Uncharacterized protein n=1 Tax=Rhodotorula mucilaginosa TaxID=5537 RepID=A0A9P6W4K0_RHOMI|nr:hypothetical protein C6P46_002417 [Rhodotorula mucilaginosa]TKA53755.1 hypothetical protein B0A53_03797 [Rhodotorula sp. CCFEE 5036]